MKKIILSLFLISSLLYAKSTIYLGTGYAYNSETVSYNSNEETIDNNAARIKIGYGDINAYAIEFSLDYIDNKSSIFDSNDGKKYGFNVELLKAWNFNIFMNPFIKAGFGAGYLETPADVNNASLTYGSWNLGCGVFIPLNEHFDIEIAYEHKNVSYQKLDNNESTNPTSSLNIGYIGINFRF